MVCQQQTDDHFQMLGVVVILLCRLSTKGSLLLTQTQLWNPHGTVVQEGRRNPASRAFHHPLQLNHIESLSRQTCCKWVHLQSLFKHAAPKRVTFKLDTPKLHETSPFFGCLLRHVVLNCFVGDL